MIGVKVAHSCLVEFRLSSFLWVRKVKGVLDDVQFFFLLDIFSAHVFEDFVRQKISLM